MARRARRGRDLHHLRRGSASDALSDAPPAGALPAGAHRLHRRVDDPPLGRAPATRPGPPFDVVYRATKLPYWFGSHGQLKHRIAERVLDRAPAHALTADISTRWEDTVFGDAWGDFLMSGRVVIGTESGSSVLDRRGEVQARIRALLAERPGLSFEEVADEMPRAGTRGAFFADHPRHLEAVVARTAQVLVEGAYSGVLEPDRHYIPLRRDFSNLDDVLERLDDRRLVQETADRAYEEIVVEGRYRYAHFAAAIREALEVGPGLVRPLRRAAFPAIATANRVAATSLVAKGRAERRLRRPSAPFSGESGCARATDAMPDPARRPALLVVSPDVGVDTTGGERIRKLTSAFDGEGWRLIGITPPARDYLSSEAPWPSSLVVHRAPDVNPWSIGVSLKRRARGRAQPLTPTPHGGEGAAGMPIAGEALASAALRRLWPYPWLGWVPFAVATGIAVAHRERPVALFSSFPPTASHMAALALHELTGLPWVADFRDPWTWAGTTATSGRASAGSPSAPRRSSSAARRP